MPTFDKLTLVAIDDNPADLELLRMQVESITQWECLFEGIADPQSAHERLNSIEASVLLIDFSMASTSGIELLESLRIQGNRTPAILLTGYGDENLAVRALHAGFADYIPKNLMSGETLQRSIGNVLEKHHLAVRNEETQAELRVVVGHLEAKNREISSFYHTLAHELKTPLTAAREFISIVNDEVTGPVNDQQTELLQSAKNSCDQLHRCIEDLYDVSRLETGKLRVVREPSSLASIVQRVVHSMEPQAMDREINLELDIADNLPQLELDSQRIFQVVSNLLSNAYKFTRSGGSISVHCGLDDRGSQVFSVKDNGIGIQDEDLGHIFERLYQAKSDTGMKSGMGLGLHLCKQLIQMHGGRISVRSKPGQGSEFRFALPPKPICAA